MLSDNIYKILENTEFSVYEGWYSDDITGTYTTFLIYNCTPDSFEDDDYTEEYYAIQVDTWGTDKEEVERQYKDVKTNLKANDFLWMDSSRDYETETKIYHYADRFNVTLERED